MADRSLSPSHSENHPTARPIQFVAEGVLLALIAISPWPFASVEPIWEFVINAGLAVLLLLWASHAIVTRRFTYAPDIVANCLLGLVLITAFQLIPLPISVVRILSPQAAEWHTTLIPERAELLPGESESARTQRTNWLPLSIDTTATRLFLARLVAIFLVYAVARNLIASKRAFHRLAWVGFGNGLLLTLLAVSQYLSGSRSKIYGTEMLNQVFGPFVNKNHYPFYLNLCIGLGLGLLALTVRGLPTRQLRDELAPHTLRHSLSELLGRVSEWIQSPRAVALLCGIGLMLVSIPFSLSRGGVLATIVALGVTTVTAFRNNGGRTSGVLLGLGIVAIGFAVWFGWGPVGERLSSVGQANADNRTPLWQEIWPVATRFPLTGTGGGSLPRAEMTFRTVTTTQPRTYNSVANEYLEAAVEGGVVRAMLTVLLALGAVGMAIRGASRLRERTVGALLLGCVFGLTAIAVHSVVDFGLHMPAVALLASVVVGYVSQAHAERSKTRERNGDVVTPVADVKSRSRPGPVVLTGPIVYPVAAFLVIIGSTLTAIGWQDVVVSRLQLAAHTVMQTSDPDRGGRAIGFLEAAIRLHPGDAELWNQLATVHFAIAQDHAVVPCAAIAGPLAVITPPDVVLAEDQTPHVLPGLRAARTARNLGPILPGPHIRLGSMTRVMARSEPPIVHYSRAKRVAAFDPDIWYLSGAAALASGELEVAWADWHESLRRSPRRLEPIVRQASNHVPANLLRTQVLPDEPFLWVRAATILELDPETRQDWLRAAVERWRAKANVGHIPDQIDELNAWASANTELGDVAASRNVWRLGAETFPDSTAILDRYSATLEAEERYAEAIPLLERLLRLRRDHRDYADRLDAARHALTLQKWIDQP